MSRLGITPGDSVLVIEHRGEQQIVYNAVVVRLCMWPGLAAPKGEMAIEAAFVSGSNFLNDPVTRMTNVVHITHRDWLEGRAALAYEELPFHPPGICRFCRCTERRACAEGCAWIDSSQTICDAVACFEKLQKAILEDILDPPVPGAWVRVHTDEETGEQR